MHLPGALLVGKNFTDRALECPDCARTLSRDLFGDDQLIQSRESIKKYLLDYSRSTLFQSSLKDRGGKIQTVVPTPAGLIPISSNWKSKTSDELAQTLESLRVEEIDHQSFLYMATSILRPENAETMMKGYLGCLNLCYASKDGFRCWVSDVEDKYFNVEFKNTEKDEVAFTDRYNKLPYTLDNCKFREGTPTPTVGSNVPRGGNFQLEIVDPAQPARLFFATARRDFSLVVPRTSKPTVIADFLGWDIAWDGKLVPGVGANSGWPGIAQTGWPPRKTGKHRPWPVLPALYALVDDLVG